MLSKLELSEEGDWLLMQQVFRRVFDDCVCKYFTALAPAVEQFETQVTLTSDELNALRYACGYVAHSLLKIFERRRKKEAKLCQFITCLGDMAIAGEGESVLSYREVVRYCEPRRTLPIKR